MNLLSVDWDFFADMSGENEPKMIYLYDWGHSEKFSEPVLGAIWQGRAVGFIQFDLPLPTTSSEETTFWSRFQFSEDCELFIADSHKAAMRPAVSEGITEVWNYDAHHDCGYNKDALKHAKANMRVACEDWLLGYNIINGLSGSDIHIRYPRWRHYALKNEPKPPLKNVDRQVDDGKPVDVIFDRIVVARSGAWVPPWLDDRWEQFIQDCPVEVTDTLDEFTMVRDWDISLVQQELDARKQLMKMHEAAQQTE